LCYKEANRKVYTGKLKITPCEHFVDKSALEKQIPKKPKTIDGKQEWYCDCGVKLYEISSNIEWGHKAPYCEHCGQALDWGDCE
jgi:hypothetical protein